MKTCILFSIASLVIGTSLRTASAAPLLFDSLNGTSSTSIRTAESSPGVEVSIASTITLNDIAVNNNLDSPGNMKFLVFNATTLLPIYVGPAIPETTGTTWKISSDFSLVLQPGLYDIGAISDTSGEWTYDVTAGTASGITSLVTNPNFSVFAAPVDSNRAGADGAVRLYGAVGVPEPTSGILTALGIASLSLRRRRIAV